MIETKPVFKSAVDQTVVEQSFPAFIRDGMSNWAVRLRGKYFIVVDELKTKLEDLYDEVTGKAVLSQEHIPEGTAIKMLKGAGTLNLGKVLGAAGIEENNG
jgi:predicted ATP-grasp superfamily ATP-dependent carboligase